MFEKATWFDKLPNDELDVYQPFVTKFFETMYERQMIWKRRFVDGEPRPWTDDHVLHSYKFTNVYRELDRSSQWQISNIILDDGLSLKDLVWKTVMFRLFNNPETFDFNPVGKKIDAKKFGIETVLGFQNVDISNIIPSSKWRNGMPNHDEFNEEEFYLYISGVRSSGKNPFTDAYFINSTFGLGRSRDFAYTRIVAPYLHEHMDELMDTVMNAEKAVDVIKYLETIPGVATFISHEIYQDFTYISRYTDREFMKFDQNDFTNVGPGCSVGVRLTFPSLYGQRNQIRGIYELRDMADVELAKISKKRGQPFPYLHWDKSAREYELKNECNITLHQVEMWLCEFQKYWKMTIGEGKQRFTFIPK